MTLTFADSVVYLLGLTYRGIAPDDLHKADEARPARAAALLAEFGSPQRSYPTIHVTGTKGKGSVSTMLCAILQAAGYRVGLLTSPHLQDIRERIQVNRTMIPEADFARLVESALPMFAKHDQTRFPECLQTIAFRYFAEQHVDFAIIEVGIGGRLDATNVLDPEVAIFTSISFDHMYLLGETLAAITEQKAGIIKPGCQVVSAAQAAEVVNMLRNKSADNDAKLTVMGEDLAYHGEPPQRDGQRFRLGILKPENRYRTRLIGQHQGMNGAVAVLAARALRERGFTIPERAIHDGLGRVIWPGRLEIVARDPLIVLDGAHNGDSAIRLREAILSVFRERPIVMIYGAKARKDVVGTLREIVPIADHIVLTRAADSLAQAPDALRPFLDQSGYRGPVTIAESGAAEALSVARQIAGPTGLVLVTGSLYLVGDARTALGIAANEPV